MSVRRRFLACAGIAAATMLALTGAAFAQAAAVKGAATLSKADGYARLIVKLDEAVPAEIRVTGSVLIVQFKKPIDVAVGKLAEQAPDYVAMARRDPDGSAIRLALSQKVTPNVMPAGEQLFIDLLPASWKGLPPSLPQEVVNELAQRARTAELQLQQQRVSSAAKAQQVVRVRAATQPTFVRLAFDIDAGINVTSDQQRDKVRLQFFAPMKFDLGDVYSVLPPDVTGVTQTSEDDATTLEIVVRNGISVRAFREEKSFIVDLGAPGFADAVPDKPAAAAVAMPPPAALDEVKPRIEADNPAAAEIAARRPEPAPSAPAAVDVKPSAPVPPSAVAAEASRTSENLRVFFPFDDGPPAALFRRADVLWVVFDTQKPIVLDALARISASPIGEFSTMPLSEGQAVRLKLAHPQLASLSFDGGQWTVTIADAMPAAPQPLSLARTGVPGRNGVVIAFDRPGRVHRLPDPDSGEMLSVITGGAPMRGFLKRQDFVEFSILESAHGVVVDPHSDDLAIRFSGGEIVIDRPGGMALSIAQTGPARSPVRQRALFDLALWRDNEEARFDERLNALMAAAAAAPEGKRAAARLDVARFYLARGFYHEAKGTLDAAISEMKAGAEDPLVLATHAVAAILAGRMTDGLKSLDNPAVGSGYDSEIWRGLAFAADERWLEAREKFKNAEPDIARLPIQIQRVTLIAALKAFIGARDYTGATARFQELGLIGIPPAIAPQVAVLRGRLAEALGRDVDAALDYAEALHSPDRAAAAEATLRDVALRQKRKEISSDELLTVLETLAVSWRGDAVEIETLRILSKEYASLDRYREMFATVRTATRLRPNADLVRQMQDDAAALFTDVFLGQKGDDLPPIDALGLFYEFRELTPIGRRGDEMIRRLSDRLVAVDLLDQASELLQYQVDHRIEGAARAQVAARLAMIYLMNRKPDRAIAALQGTRITDLAGELRLQRLLLESRAQSDYGRTDLALDIISNVGGREAIRLRSDIYWRAKRWREAAEQIELLHGDRWKSFEPLSAPEKADILRAAIGYALSDDSLGISRLREKYAAKFDGETDRASFDLATRPANGNAVELARLARMAASVDTLDNFLRDIRSRFADAAHRVTQTPPGVQKADPATTGSLPQIPLLKAPAAKAKR